MVSPPPEQEDGRGGEFKGRRVSGRATGDSTHRASGTGKQPTAVQEAVYLKKMSMRNG